MRTVGKSLIRKDSLGKVTGSSKFIDDYNLPDQLHAKVLTSTQPHAVIKNIDVRAAMAVPDVKCILTYKDIPGVNILPLIIPDMPFLAEEKVNFPGEAVVLIAARTKSALEEAHRKIKIYYQPIKPVFSIKEAVKKNNIHKSYQILRGDIIKGFKEADVIIENEYFTPYQEHAYIETNGILAQLTEGGGIKILGSMQCPFYVQDAVAKILGIEHNKVQVIQATTGGAFGGKEDVPSLIAGWAALLSYHTKRPVKLILSREEDIISMSKRHPGYIKYKTGIKSNGTLTAVDVQYYLNGGAYATLSPAVIWRGSVHALGPYACENIKIKASAVRTNLVPCGAFRGFGTPQILFAHESQMDIAAHKLNMDPAQLRRINLLKKGDKTSTGQILSQSIGSFKTLNKALKESRWKYKKDKYKKENKINSNIKKGIGISTVFYGVGLGAGGKHHARSGAFVQIHKDGSINIAVGTTEMGQGMQTVLSQITSEAFGIDLNLVNILEVDTSRVPDSGPTVASRSTFTSGNAILDACNKIKERMEVVAGQILKSKTKKFIWENNFIITESNNKGKITYLNLVLECFKRHIHLAQQGWYKAPPTSFNLKDGQGDAYFTYSYAANIAEVEVNIKTFEVTIKKITAAHDMGKAINPKLVEGQIEGGTLQGIGYALMEEVLLKDGRIINPNFSTYIIPTVFDMPVIKPFIIEENYSKGPYGSKGFGELPLMGVAPAIANAVYDACKIRVFELPLTGERLLERSKNAGS